MKSNSVNCSTDDYDFYTIPLPVKVFFHHQKNRYISAQLEKRHPCFSDDCCFDTHLRLEKTGLKADVVVMQKYKIAEYKALHKRLFVKERQNIRFFYSNKMLVPFCIITLIVAILVLFFLTMSFQNKKQTTALIDSKQINTLTDSSAYTVAKQFFAPELLNKITELNGCISDFVWAYDGYSESVSVLIKGLYPEQLDCFPQYPYSLRFSSVSFEKSIPCFSVTCEDKINQITNIEIQNLGNRKNDFRQKLLQNNIRIQEESVSPFGIKFVVALNQIKIMPDVLKYIAEQNLCISKIKINSANSGLKTELVFSEVEYKNIDELYTCLINCVDSFLPEQETVVPKVSQITNQGSPQKHENLIKIGQITKPDGSVIMYYRDENEKIVMR